MKSTKTNRIWAFLIDAVIVSILANIVQNILPNVFTAHHREIASIPMKISIGGPIATYFFYFLLFDLFNKGVTIGKMLLKIFVVETNEDSLDATKHILRSVIKLVSLTFLPISALVYLITDAWTLQDKAMNTKTVYQN